MFPEARGAELEIKNSTMPACFTTKSPAIPTSTRDECIWGEYHEIHSQSAPAGIADASNSVDANNLGNMRPGIFKAPWFKPHRTTVGRSGDRWRLPDGNVTNGGSLNGCREAQLSLQCLPRIAQTRVIKRTRRCSLETSSIASLRATTLLSASTTALSRKPAPSKASRVHLVTETRTQSTNFTRHPDQEREQGDKGRE